MAATGEHLVYNLPSASEIPVGATHLLVLTRNPQGEMLTGISTQIVDKGVPTHSAAMVTFSDTDVAGGFLAGEILITKAEQESDITHYVIYWGSSATSKLPAMPSLAELAANGADLSFTIAEGTEVPAGATHFIVFSCNAGGEKATGTSVLIIDVGVPTNLAAAISFTDTDLAGGYLGGEIAITKALDETDLNAYVLYWGSSSTQKLAGQAAIATLTATGANLIHELVSGTSIPTGATHFLVFTRNTSGEMASSVSVEIIDLGVPVNAAVAVSFVNLESSEGKAGGNIIITRATDESEITHYVIYWGLTSTAKLEGQTAVASLATTGANLTHQIAMDTSIPDGATHFLVFTRNDSGEMATSVATKVGPTILFDTNLHNPAASSQAASGGAAWSNIANIQGSNTNTAGSTIFSVGGSSRYLRATDFDLSSIPDNAIITGVKVAWEVRVVASGGSSGSVTFTDDGFKLFLDDTEVGTPAETSSTSLLGGYSRRVAGGQNDLWGLDLNPESLKASTFGASIKARWASGNNNNGDGDMLILVRRSSIKVYYTFNNIYTMEFFPVAASVLDGAGQNWNNPANAIGNTDNITSVSGSSGSYGPSRLLSTKFDFSSLPDNAQIVGIDSEYHLSSSVSNTSKGTIRVNALRLRLDSVDGADQGNISTPNATLTWISAGRSNRLWDLDLTPAAMKEGDFEAVISMYWDLDNGVTASSSLRRNRLKVHYTD